jgi:hypothetical protein
VNGESTKEFKQTLQREVVRQWFQAHPNYQRQYQAKQKQRRAELGTALNGTLPVKTLKKITYSIAVTRQLKLEEKVHKVVPTTDREPAKKKQRRHNHNATHLNTPSTPADSDC